MRFPRRDDTTTPVITNTLATAACKAATCHTHTAQHQMSQTQHLPPPPEASPAKYQHLFQNEDVSREWHSDSSALPTSGAKMYHSPWSEAEVLNSGRKSSPSSSNSLTSSTPQPSIGVTRKHESVIFESSNTARITNTPTHRRSPSPGVITGIVFVFLFLSFMFGMLGVFTYGRKVQKWESPSEMYVYVMKKCPRRQSMKQEETKEVKQEPSTSTQPDGTGNV